MPDCVDVVVTHYRSVEELAGCLDVLATHAPGSIRVFVADSEALPQTESVVRAHYPGAEYLPFAHNVGYARLANAGLNLSHCPYIVVMNADVRLDGDALQAMRVHLDGSPRTGIVGPRFEYPEGGHQNTAFAFYRPETLLYRRTSVGDTALGRRELARFTLRDEVAVATRSAHPLAVDWLMGATLMIRRSALLDVGQFDERYFMYFEDVDLCIRMWRAHWRVEYLPEARALHAWGRASKGGGVLGIVTNRLLQVHLRSAALFFSRWGTSPTRHASPREKQAQRRDMGELTRLSLVSQPTAPATSEAVG